jgi:hypothetical protein
MKFEMAADRDILKTKAKVEPTSENSPRTCFFVIII